MSEEKQTPEKFPPLHFMELQTVGEGIKRKVVPLAHQVADQLFGWSSQVYHYGADSFTMTAEDYEKALAAAMAYPSTNIPRAAVAPVAKSKFSKRRNGGK